MKANDLDIVNHFMKFMNTYLDKRGPLENHDVPVIVYFKALLIFNY